MPQITYAVDVKDGEAWEPITRTNLTFGEAEKVARKEWEDGGLVRVLAWTKENGYTEVAHFG